ncbi:MAG TPA: hypothetical protein VMB25_12310 [Bryobacteraceae bacterium]|nr:hypothetical protein [Bryobacteraceae bacterium]
MTVCIAVMCQLDGLPRILLCSDSRLDYGYSGATDQNIKISDIGHGWCSMFASDDWASAQHLKDHLAARWQQFPTPETKEAAYVTAKVVLEEFLTSALHGKSTKEVLLCGYIGDPPSPMILKGLVKGKRVSLDSVPTFAVIGSGGYIAQVFLGQRNCKPTDSMEVAAYIVYEAKHYSERASGVGPGTLIGALAPPLPGTSGIPSVKAQLNKRAMSFLEDQCQKLGLRPVPALAKFPDEFFVRPPIVSNPQ